jgi:hypothetical protein
MHISEAATRVTPTEMWETKNPWLVRRFELAADSARENFPHAFRDAAQKTKIASQDAPTGFGD